MNVKRAPYMFGVLVLTGMACGIGLAVFGAEGSGDTSVPTGRGETEQNSEVRYAPTLGRGAVRKGSRLGELARGPEEPGELATGKTWPGADPWSESWEEQDAGTDADVEDEPQLDEDEAMARLDNRPEPAVWRGGFRSEKHDPAWTARMREELNQKARKFLNGEVEVQQLDCRETVCRMFLTFDDDKQGAAFRQSQHDSAIDYAYQDMNPSRKDAEQWGITYEVLVKRERPSDLKVEESDPGTLDPGESPRDRPSAATDEALEVAQAPATNVDPRRAPR